jgi:UDP-glucose 6-dehydrogenase
MKISVFGVGSATAACLAGNCHEVICVDSDRGKVRHIQAGRSTVLELSLQDLVNSAVAAGGLRATTRFAEAVAGSEVSLICVGTIVGSNGRYIRGKLPHIAALMTTSFGALLRHVEILVLGQDATKWRRCDKHFRSDHIDVDLVRVKRPGLLTGS